MVGADGQEKFWKLIPSDWLKHTLNLSNILKYHWKSKAPLAQKDEE